MINEITAEELNKLRQEKADFVLVDVREPSEFDSCNIGGKLIPLGSLPDRIDELDKNQHIVVHCKLGGRSRRAAEFLEQSGFTHVSNLTGGMMAWIEKVDPSLKGY